MAITRLTESEAEAEAEAEAEGLVFQGSDQRLKTSMNIIPLVIDFSGVFYCSFNHIESHQLYELIDIPCRTLTAAPLTAASWRSSAAITETTSCRWSRRVHDERLWDWSKGIQTQTPAGGRDQIMINNLRMCN